MFDKQVYVSRRGRLAQMMPDSLLLFVGNDESAFNYADNTFRFRQDSTFLYLFGLDTPGLAVLMDTATGQTTLFADDISMDDLVWTGPMPSVAERAATAGIDSTRPASALADVVARARRGTRRVHYVPPYRGNTVIRLAELLCVPTRQARAEASEQLVRAMVALRSVKEQCEIDDIERQMAFGANMHRAAMRLAHAGHSENDVMARMEMEALRGGGPVSFPTICTINGQTLHNHGYLHELHTGQLLLVDAGCESPNHYATDNTRTSPVGGHFTPRQKEIYQIVLNANNAVISQAKPGVPYLEMHKLAASTIVDGLKQVGLMKGDTAEAVETGAYALFMPHGIGHMMGLDVHDMESYGEDLVGYDHEFKRSPLFGFSALRLARRLQEGFVVTDEPGIYFIPQLIDRWQAEHLHDDFINFARLESYKDFGGIRLEDDLLITPAGCRVLGERIPISIADVENEVLNGIKEERNILTHQNV